MIEEVSMEGAIANAVRSFTRGFHLEAESDNEIQNLLAELREHVSKARLSDLDYDVIKLFGPSGYIDMYLGALAYRIRDVLGQDVNVLIADRTALGEARAIYEVFAALLSGGHHKSLGRRPSSSIAFYSGVYEGVVASFAERLAWGSTGGGERGVHAHMAARTVMALYSALIGKWVAGLYGRLYGIVGQGAGSVIASIITQDEGLLYRSVYSTFDYLYRKYVDTS